MGTMNSLFLLVVAYKAVVFHFDKPNRRVFSSFWYDVLFGISVFSIALLSLWALYQTLLPI
jgi:hypothetical protein